MDLVTEQLNVYEALHASIPMKVWHDPYLRWWVQVDDTLSPSSLNTKRAAQGKAHGLVHMRVSPTKCDSEIIWSLQPWTRTEVLGACPACGNPNTRVLKEQLGNWCSLSCPDCD